MKNKLIWILIFAAYIFNAQTDPIKRTCATMVPDQAWNNWFNSKVDEFKKNNPANKTQSANYTIPVVFHVIHGGQAVGTFPNISQAQIKSQVDILNKDYSGTGFNVGNIANTTFSPSLIADCNINFCLAEKDPSGTLLSEKGIHRVDYVAKGWSNPTTYTTANNFRSYIDNTVKLNTIWDPTRYLNIWVTDVNSSVGLLGYATFPPASALTGIPAGPGTLTDDGVWCWSKAVGDVGTLASLYNKGRTATHEIGHYLGLRHIWGDANCGNDYCNDTPVQQQDNLNCPTFPHVTCNNGPKGDLFINFMDYCYDACMYMFTNDQRTRMQTAMANSPLRMNLSASAAALCDGGVACSNTVSNFSSTDTLRAYRRATASLEDTQCPQGVGKAGYITGTNCYDDKEKAEFINALKYNGIANPVVTAVIVLFFQYGNMGTEGNGTVSLNIYDGSSETSAPGNLRGSVTANLSTIGASTNTTSVPYCGNPNNIFSVPLIMPYKFNFATPPKVMQNGGFYASVVLPTSAGDTVAIMDKSTGTLNTAWEKWSNNTWHSMKDDWGNSRNFNLAIIPVVECGPVGIKENSILKSGVDLFPNPSNGNFTIITTLPSPQNLNINVYNLLGESVYKESIENAKQNLIDVNLSDQSAGIYFVEVNNGQEKVVKRLVLTR